MVQAYSSSESGEPNLRQFVEHPDVVILDVRSTDEFNEGHIGVPYSHCAHLSPLLLSSGLNFAHVSGVSRHIPVQELPERLEELPSDLETPICCFCRIGQRSGLAKRFLEQVGYTNVVNGISLEKVCDAMDTNPVR